MRNHQPQEISMGKVRLATKSSERKGITSLDAVKSTCCKLGMGLKAWKRRDGNKCKEGR